MAVRLSGVEVMVACNPEIWPWLGHVWVYLAVLGLKKGGKIGKRKFGGKKRTRRKKEKKRRR